MIRIIIVDMTVARRIECASYPRFMCFVHDETKNVLRIVSFQIKHSYLNFTLYNVLYHLNVSVYIYTFNMSSIKSSILYYYIARYSYYLPCICSTET